MLKYTEVIPTLNVIFAKRITLKEKYLSTMNNIYDFNEIRMIYFKHLFDKKDFIINLKIALFIS